MACPYPGKDVMDRIRKQRNEKSVLKKKRKDAIMREQLRQMEIEGIHTQQPTMFASMIDTTKGMLIV